MYSGGSNSSRMHDTSVISDFGNSTMGRHGVKNLFIDDSILEKQQEKTKTPPNPSGII